MKSIDDKFTLNNGVGIPCIGFGTWQSPDGETATNAVATALRDGYRHIDTAAFYGNEKSVGVAVKQSGLNREDVFVTSKLWNTDRGYDKTIKAFDLTLKNLGFEYLDMYLIHWPAVSRQFADWADINADTWRAFEQLHRDGRIRAIGVSNFKPHHLEALMERAQIMPAVNQIEYHPGQPQPETVSFCGEHNILVEAWSPLGQGGMLTDPTLGRIAAKYGKSVAQLCIRWCLQNGVLPLPKSVTPTRILENAEVFGFSISDDDMSIINRMPYIGGSGLDPDLADF